MVKSAMASSAMSLSDSALAARARSMLQSRPQEVSFMQHRQGPGFSALQAPFDALHSHHVTHPAIGRPFPGKLFLREPLALSGAEISLNRLPAGARLPFLHRHREHEEIYVFVAGEGEFQAGDEVFAVGPGSVVKVQTWLPRSWRSTGDTPLDYVVIQVPENGFIGAGAIDDGVEVAQRPAWMPAGAAAAAAGARDAEGGVDGAERRTAS
jgi:mannose-6-phosphate isomerase-like protein (cupin superfamily)